MKFIKTVAVLLAVSVFLIVPSFAWDSDSFVGQDFYFYEPVINYAAQSPSLMAAGDTSSDSSTKYDINDFSFSCDDFSFYSSVDGWWPPFNVGSVNIPGYWITYSSDPVSVSGFKRYSPAYCNFYSDSYTVPVVDVPSDTITTFKNWRLRLNPVTWKFTLNFSSSVTAFSLDGLLNLTTSVYLSGTQYENRITSCRVFVDGRLVSSFSLSSTNVFDFGGYVYSSPTSFSTIQLVFSTPARSISGDFEGTSFDQAQILVADTSTFSLSVLSGDGILSGQAGSTQDDVNEIEGIESQWGNSMTENFNALSLDTFTYPDGLTAGFSLISGIFQDLWNAMGSYSILYVLPLTLAVVLLLIGRISKFAGQGRSSPSKEE